MKIASAILCVFVMYAFTSLAKWRVCLMCVDVFFCLSFIAVTKAEEKILGSSIAQTMLTE